MVSVKQPQKLGLLHILLIALLLSQASLLFQPAWARAFEANRKLLTATDKVTDKITSKETKIATTKEATMGSKYWRGGGGGGGGGCCNHGGGGWNHGGGGWNHGGGGWNHGGGGSGHGGGGWSDRGLDHRDGKNP